MNRLFLFCIGGTGSRVLKSLIYLLAAGVEFPAKQLIPIIIDPDKDNGNVEEVIRLLKNYKFIRDNIDPDKSDFFKVDIKRLSEIVDGDIAELKGFKSDVAIEGVVGKTFKEFLSFDTLDLETKALLEVLYDVKTNLESDMSIGFKGNPHMGSIVLNRFQESEDFKAFVNKITDEDRVFIASSIFGGTGAAGFPLLIKNIREPHADYIGKAGVLKKVPLGAIAVKPYFGVEKKEGGPIDKDTFINKTKAALSFHGKDLDGINALYYIGDKVHKDYDNTPGGKNQKNKAHFIEMISALAIVDFISKKKTDFNTNINGEAEDPFFKEFGFLTEKDNPKFKLDFRHLGTRTRQILAPPLTKFFYTISFWQEQLLVSLNNTKLPFVRGRHGLPIQETFVNSPFFSDYITPFINGYIKWLKEMADNERSFAPFNFDALELNDKIRNIQQKKKGIWKSSKWNFNDFEGALNKHEQETNGMSVETKLLYLFSKASQDIYSDRIEDALIG